MNKSRLSPYEGPKTTSRILLQCLGHHDYVLLSSLVFHSNDTRGEDMKKKSAKKTQTEAPKEKPSRIENSFNKLLTEVEQFNPDFAKYVRSKNVGRSQVK